MKQDRGSPCWIKMYEPPSSSINHTYTRNLKSSFAQMHYITHNSNKPRREVEHRRSPRANSTAKKKHIPPSSERKGGRCLSENSPCFTIILYAEILPGFSSDNLGCFPLLSTQEGIFLDTRCSDPHKKTSGVFLGVLEESITFSTLS